MLLQKVLFIPSEYKHIIDTPATVNYKFQKKKRIEPNDSGAEPRRQHARLVRRFQEDFLLQRDENTHSRNHITQTSGGREVFPPTTTKRKGKTPLIFILHPTEIEKSELTADN